MRTAGRTGRLAAAFALLLPAAVTQEPEFRRIEVRVISSPTPGTATIDRGSIDRLAAGDAVELRPRTGGVLRGTILRLDERSALVELNVREALPAPGTRGDVRVPATRFATPQPAPPPPAGERPPAERPPPEHPPWQNQDPKFTPDQPLLAQVDAVRPEDRLASVSGRLYTIGDLTVHPESDFDESFFRGGIELRADNPFGGGGTLRLDGEFDYRTEFDDESGSNLLVRDLSYRVGGDRFSPNLYQFGRFLQNGMPEFGTVDGFEWNVRGRFGDRFGVSLGFLPTPDDNFEGWNDPQIAAHYVWHPDLTERTRLGVGYQKTWHESDQDRDLFVLKGHHLPVDGWQFDGTFWIDWYSSDDAIKGSGVDLTQAFVSAGRKLDGGNRLLFSYRRHRYPDVLRREYIPTIPTEIADDRSDRLTFEYWLVASAATTWHGYLSGWDDEDHDGVAGELAIETRDWIGERSLTELGLFGNTGEAGAVAGARVRWEQDVEDGVWRLLYEFTYSHEFGFPSDIANLDQHRVRVDRDFFSDGGSDLSLYAEGRLWAEDVSLSAGFYYQYRF